MIDTDTITGTVTLRTDGRLVITGTPYRPDVVALMHALPHSRWNRAQKHWTCVATPYAARQLEIVGLNLDSDAWQLSSTWETELADYDRLNIVTRLKPWDHQRAAIEHCWNRYAPMLAMDMGTGKTKSTLDLIGNKQCQRVLIVCPKSVQDVWPEQIEIHGPDNMRAFILPGNSTRTKLNAMMDAFIDADRAHCPLTIIVNYESVWRGALGNTILGLQRWDAIVLDESHRIKSPTGKASVFFDKLRPRAALRICLTGTPMPHSPLDLFGQFRFLEPAIFGTSFGRFRDRYADTHPTFPSKVLRWKNQDELQQKFNLLAFRVKADDVLDLPPVHEIDMPVSMTGEQKRVYDELESDMIAGIHDGTVTASNALVRVLRLQQVTSGHVADNDGTVHSLPNPKRDALADMLTDMDAGEPVVVFCRFRHDLAAIADAANAAGRNVRELSGKVNELDAWKRDGSGSVLACQIKSGGIGVDLTRSAACVFYSVTSLGDYLQACARVHRPGQTRTTRIWHLVCRNSVDRILYRAFRERLDVVESVMAAWGA